MRRQIDDSDRDTRIYHGDAMVGALMSGEGITAEILYEVVGILCTFSHQFYLRDEAGDKLLGNPELVVAGSYFIVTDDRLL